MSRPRIVVRCPAKVNLGLEVLGRRPDGYHEIVTVLQAIDLRDELVWTETGAPFAYQGPPGIEPSSDLVRRALDLAPDRAVWTGTLRLHKHIPTAAGLGGGSSDAALALRLAFPGPIDSALEERAASLGSDVPFFLRGGTALATGTGTTLEPLRTPPLSFVIVVPPVEIAAKTTSMYGRLRQEDFTDGSALAAIADAIRNGRPLPARIPCPFMPHVDSASFQQAREQIRTLLGEPSMTGAGPALYKTCPNRSEAAEAANLLGAIPGRVLVASAIDGTLDPEIGRLAAAIRGTILS